MVLDGLLAQRHVSSASSLECVPGHAQRACVHPGKGVSILFDLPANKCLSKSWLYINIIWIMSKVPAGRVSLLISIWCLCQVHMAGMIARHGLWVSACVSTCMECNCHPCHHVRAAGQFLCAACAVFVSLVRLLMLVLRQCIVQ